MNEDNALLHQKIDYLTEQIEQQRIRLETFESQSNGNSNLSSKIDYLIDHFEAQRHYQEEMEELKRDVIPIANHMMKLSIDELAEIGTEFQAEDLLFLVKRLLRDTHLIVGMLDRLEAGVELIEETQMLSQGIFNQSVNTLDRFEREGYFDFARESWKIIERIVDEFSKEDVQALGENIVTILKTVKNLTQPEIMSLTNNALQAVQDQPVTDEDISIWALMRDLSDPQVRRGLAKLLNIVKAVADQPESQEK